MNERITWATEGVEMPTIDFELVANWLEQVAHEHGRIVGYLSYLFCNDDKIIEINKHFLSHDYYTDIITFDYSRSKMVSGDMYISLDTVASNAQTIGVDPMTELHRVIVHGLLHLCGINDKGPGEREIMEQHENAALSMLYKDSQNHEI